MEFWKECIITIIFLITVAARMACKKSMPMPAADHKYCAMEEVHMGTEGKPHNNRDYNRTQYVLINYYMWHIQIKDFHMTSPISAMQKRKLTYKRDNIKKLFVQN